MSLINHCSLRCDRFTRRWTHSYARERQARLCRQLLLDAAVRFVIILELLFEHRDLLGVKPRSGRAIHFLCLFGGGNNWLFVLAVGRRVQLQIGAIKLQSTWRCCKGCLLERRLTDRLRVLVGVNWVMNMSEIHCYQLRCNLSAKGLERYAADRIDVIRMYVGTRGRD